MTEKGDEKTIISFSRGSFRPSFLGSSVCSSLPRIGVVLNTTRSDDEGSDDDDSKSNNEHNENNTEIGKKDSSDTNGANQTRESFEARSEDLRLDEKNLDLKDLIYDFVAERLASDSDSTNMSLKAWVSEISDMLNLSFNICSQPELYSFVKRTIFDQAEMYCSQSQSQSQSDIQETQEQKQEQTQTFIHSRSDTRYQSDAERSGLNGSETDGIEMEPGTENSSGDESLTDQFKKPKKRKDKKRDKKREISKVKSTGSKKGPNGVLKRRASRKSGKAEAYGSAPLDRNVDLSAVTEDDLSSVHSDGSTNSSNSARGGDDDGFRSGSDSDSFSCSSKSIGEKNTRNPEKQSIEVIKLSIAEEELRVQKAIESGNINSVIPNGEYMRYRYINTFEQMKFYDHTMISRQGRI